MLIFGHKGAPGSCEGPENSLLSFEHALTSKVDAIEFDVHLCRSGELIVIHDSFVDEVTKKVAHGFVREKTLEELKTYDIGAGQKIPTVHEILELINNKTRINIELKGQATAEPVAKIINEYVDDERYTFQSFMISSFDHYQLKEFNNILPQVEVGVLFAGIPTSLEFAEQVNASSVNPCAIFLHKEFIDDAQKQGFKVFVWTLNESKFPDYIKNMEALGADGVFTEYPDKARVILED